MISLHTGGSIWATNILQCTITWPRLCAKMVCPLHRMSPRWPTLNDQNQPRSNRNKSSKLWCRPLLLILVLALFPSSSSSSADSRPEWTFYRYANQNQSNIDHSQWLSKFGSNSTFTKSCNDICEIKSTHAPNIRRTESSSLHVSNEAGGDAGSCLDLLDEIIPFLLNDIHTFHFVSFLFCFNHLFYSSFLVFIRSLSLSFAESFLLTLRIRRLEACARLRISTHWWRTRLNRSRFSFSFHSVIGLSLLKSNHSRLFYFSFCLLGALSLIQFV